MKFISLFLLTANLAVNAQDCHSLKKIEDSNIKTWEFKNQSLILSEIKSEKDKNVFFLYIEYENNKKTEFYTLIIEQNKLIVSNINSNIMDSTLIFNSDINDNSFNGFFQITEMTNSKQMAYAELSYFKDSILCGRTVYFGSLKTIINNDINCLIINELSKIFNLCIKFK